MGGGELGILTGLPERLIVEPCLPDLEGVPLFRVELLVDVDDIEMLVLVGLSDAVIRPSSWGLERTIQSS